jgi:hypothetical protein
VLDHKDWRSAVSVNAVISCSSRACRHRHDAGQRIAAWKVLVPKQLTCPRSIAAAVLRLKAADTAWLAWLVED